MRPQGRGGIPLLLALLALLALAAPAAAHADLVSATPPANSRVETAPTELVLLFSEGLEDRYTQIQVVDRNGTHYEGPTHVDPDVRTRATVSLRPMPDGVYVVHWRTLSVDTHTKEDSYLLGVRTNITDDPHGGHHGGHTPVMDHGHEGVSHSSPSEAVTRGVGFMAASLAVGIPLFLVAVARGREATLPRRRLLWIASTSAAVAAVATVILAAHIASRIDSTLFEAFATTAGEALAWRTGLFLASAGLLAGLALREGRTPFPRLLLAGLLGAGALAATSAASHAAAAQVSRDLLLASDWAHLAAVAAWVGGVVALLSVVASRSADPGTVSVLVKRFSPLAVVAVVIIVATGTYASIHHVGKPADLLDTGYGQALLLKIALMLPLLALGAMNQTWNGPGLAGSSPQRHLRRLRVAVAAEIGLMAVVLIAAGVLANVAPPGAAPPATEEIPTPTGLVHEFTKDGHLVSVAVTPQPVKAGAQTLTVTVGPPGKAVPAKAAINLYLYPPSDPNGEGKYIPLEHPDERTWTARGPLFIEAGTWSVKVTLQGADTYVTDTFSLAVAPP